LEKYADRLKIKQLDGRPVGGWFAEDFTAAELRADVRAQERLRDLRTANNAFNDQFSIPTLQEIIDLARSETAQRGRPIGIYPETKHPSYFAAHARDRGLVSMDDALVSMLHANYGNSAAAPVYIQSFEVANLQYLHTRTDIRLVQLIDADDVNADGSMALVAPYRQPYDFVVSGDPRLFSDLLTSAGLDFVKTYADAIGPWKPYLVKTVADGVERTGDTTLNINDRKVVGSTGVIEMAHAKGLLVHTWTFRNDASGYGFKDPKAEMQFYMSLGIDGVFTDFPATGVAALKELP
jgi:glycerophosphoryl diester phosphodiesterase